jgi:protein O-mannosyl-transferase
MNPLAKPGSVWIRAALIVLAGCWVFSPALHGPWIWDDDLYITHNTLLRSAAGLGSIWSSPTGVNYFPITFTLQWLEWQAWGDNPVGYHCVNIGLHLLGSFLLWRLLFKLGIRHAWLGGLIFAVHPLAVESVAWISEQKNTMSLPFLLLAMIAWIDWDNVAQASSLRRRDSERRLPRHSPRSADEGGPRTTGGYASASPAYYLLSFLLFLAAMLCKSTVAMFPFILLLHAWWRRGRISLSDLKASIPFFAISLGLGLVTVWFERYRAMSGLEIVEAGGIFTRIAGAGLAVVYYFSKSVVPFGLSLIYPPWTLGPLWLAQLLSWLLICAVLGWLWAKRSTHALFGLGWFGINLVPVLGIVPMSYSRISWVADHFAYLPLVGLIGLAVAGLGKAEALNFLPRIRTLLVAGAIALLAIEGHRYAGVFANGETLWKYTVRHCPDSALAHNNLGLAFANEGQALAKEGRLSEAIAQYEEALRLKPDYPEVDINLGLALASAGRPAEAITRYEEALRLNPERPEVHNNLCIVLRQTGRIPEAIAEGEAALRLEPDYSEADNNLGVALIQGGHAAEAIGFLNRAVQLQPGYAEAHNNLGLALLLVGRLPEAIAREQEAIRLDPHLYRAHFALGLALAAAGRPQDAIPEFQAALSLKPDFVEARRELDRLQR